LYESEFSRVEAEQIAAAHNAGAHSYEEAVAWIEALSEREDGALEREGSATTGFVKGIKLVSITFVPTIVRGGSL